MEKTALDYAKWGCDTIMDAFSVGELPPADRFHYHQGVFLSGMDRTYLLCGEKKYNDYIKAWLDYYIDENGDVKGCDLGQFDDMQPSILLFRQYKQTGDERYKKVLDSFVAEVEKWPKNAKGGFWHKFWHKNEMWLDGLYMIGPYHAMYAKEFGKEYFYEVAYRQMRLMTDYMRDTKTGLMYHAWDDARQAPWADKDTGLSPHFWGRAIGWYMTAIMDILDFIPENDPRSAEFIQAERDIIEAVVKYQDKESGLWYQVVDRPGGEGNWCEVSCSCLFTYAISKAIRKGIIGKEYTEVIHKGYNGVIGTIREKDGKIQAGGVCIGTGVGDYDYYINRPTVTNDLHGMGAFILMCSEYYCTVNEL